MAERKRRAGKSESITLRLDPQTRFKLEFMARLRGQTFTTVVERAIASAADNTNFSDEEDFNVSYGWRDLWSDEEGERALSVARFETLFPDFDEQRRRAFAEKHWPFFFQDRKYSSFLTHYVEILWPRIDEFIQIFEDTKAKDYHAAGKAMQAALSEAKLEPPKWPPQNPQTGGGFSRDMDDDIPF